MHYNKLSIVQFKQVKPPSNNNSSQLASTTIITKRRRGRPSKKDPKPIFQIGNLQMIASTQSLDDDDNISTFLNNCSDNFKKEKNVSNIINTNRVVLQSINSIMMNTVNNNNNNNHQSSSTSNVNNDLMMMNYSSFRRPSMFVNNDDEEGQHSFSNQSIPISKQQHRPHRTSQHSFSNQSNNDNSISIIKQHRPHRTSISIKELLN